MKRTKITRANMEAAGRLLTTAAVDNADLVLAVGLGPAGPDGLPRPVLYLLQPGQTFEDADSLLTHLLEEARAGRRTPVLPGEFIPEWWSKGGPAPVPDGGKGGGG